MNSATKLLLIILRIAIGWHLLFAGIAKFAPDYRGSEGYLQEATGPLAPKFHEMVGDRLADHYAVLPPLADTDPAQTPLSDRCPVALAQEWDDLTRRFIAHYHLDERPRDVWCCEKTLESYKADTVDWMLHASKPRRVTSPWGPAVDYPRTPVERVAEYQARREQIRKEQAGELSVSLHTLFGPDKTKDLLAQKAEVARTRADLAKELDTRTSALKEPLRDVLTPETAQQYGPLPDAAKPSTWAAMSRLDWIDFLVRWGLTISGACLILGLFSRLNCLIGAALLLSFYLAVMPLPGVIEAVRVEGYPYVNKNIIEMLALLTLATTASGRWAGLDFLIYYLNPFRRRTSAPKGPPPPPDRTNGTPSPRPEPVITASHVPTRR